MSHGTKFDGTHTSSRLSRPQSYLVVIPSCDRNDQQIQAKTAFKDIDVGLRKMLGQTRHNMLLFIANLEVQ